MNSPYRSADTKEIERARSSLRFTKLLIAGVLAVWAICGAALASCVECRRHPLPPKPPSLQERLEACGDACSRGHGRMLNFDPETEFCECLDCKEQ